MTPAQLQKLMTNSGYMRIQSEKLKKGLIRQFWYSLRDNKEVMLEFLLKDKFVKEVYSPDEMTMMKVGMM